MAKIDVVICAYNEGPYVAGVLDSLCQQTTGRESFRVIFVDNGSTDDTRAIVERYNPSLQIKYVYESKLGLNFARNTGVRCVETEYVAFTDADARTDAHWIEAILDVIKKEGPDIFGGPYFPFYVNPKPRWFKDSYNSLFLGEEMRPLAESESSSGINMIWKLDVLNTLGGFNNEVGLAGRGLERGDETHLMMLAKSRIPDLKHLYCPGVIVYHLTRPQTYSMAYWIRRNFVQGLKHFKSRPTAFGNQSSKDAFKAYLYSFKELALALKKLTTRDRGQYPFWQNYVYEMMLPLIHRNAVLFMKFQNSTKKRIGKPDGPQESAPSDR